MVSPWNYERSYSRSGYKKLHAFPVDIKNEVTFWTSNAGKMFYNIPLQPVTEFEEKSVIKSQNQNWLRKQKQKYL